MATTMNKEKDSNCYNIDFYQSIFDLCEEWHIAISIELFRISIDNVDKLKIK
jgi:hypothetical protein